MDKFHPVARPAWSPANERNSTCQNKKYFQFFMKSGQILRESAAKHLGLICCKSTQVCSRCAKISWLGTEISNIFRTYAHICAPGSWRSPATCSRMCVKRSAIASKTTNVCLSVCLPVLPSLSLFWMSVCLSFSSNRCLHRNEWSCEFLF